MIMKKVDYIILGGGLSGLMLAYKMSKEQFFRDKQIIIIEKDASKENDRTWSYWEKSPSEWNSIIRKTWKNSIVKGQNKKVILDMHPYQYHTIHSKDFYDFINLKLQQCDNIQLVFETFENIEEKGNEIIVNTNENSYTCKKLFNSILDSEEYTKDSKYPYLYQHFKGWYIHTDQSQFDENTATLMDFSIPQKKETRFMYVLPFSEHKALIEFTLFTPNLLSRAEYKAELIHYIAKEFRGNFEIYERENGIIPMTCHPFHLKNSKNILYIGSAGGWTKPSTGYTFKRTDEYTNRLISFIKNDESFEKFIVKNKYWYYDLLLLDVLSSKNGKGEQLFTRLFSKNKPELVFKFLDEKTNFWEDLKIMWSFPSWLFMKAILKRMLRFGR